MKNKNNAFLFSYFYLFFFILFLLMKRICEWCGKPIRVLRHGNQRYHVVNDDGVECYKEHRKEVKRQYWNEYYRKNHETINLKKLGSSGSGSSIHRKESFTEEFLLIRREMNRLGLKKIVSRPIIEEELYPNSSTFDPVFSGDSSE